MNIRDIIASARLSALNEDMLVTDGRRALQRFADWLEQIAEREAAKKEERAA